MIDLADELIEESAATHRVNCADYDKEIDEAEQCTWDEPNADGFREITLCERYWLRRDRELSFKTAA